MRQTGREWRSVGLHLYINHPPPLLPTTLLFCFAEEPDVRSFRQDRTLKHSSTHHRRIQTTKKACVSDIALHKFHLSFGSTEKGQVCVLKILERSYGKAVQRLPNANYLTWLSWARTYLRLPLSSVTGEVGWDTSRFIVLPHVRWRRCRRNISFFCRCTFYNSAQRKTFITHATTVAKIYNTQYLCSTAIQARTLRCFWISVTMLLS